MWNRGWFVYQTTATTATRWVTSTSGAIFEIIRAKSVVPIVTLLINDSIKFSENIKQGFKSIVSWNKYTSEITTQQKITI